MIDWAVQSSLVAICALALSWLLRRRSAALREAILLAALIKFLIPPALLPFGSLVWPVEGVGVVIAPTMEPSRGSSVALVLYGIVGTLVLAVAVARYYRMTASLRTAQTAPTFIQERVRVLARAIEFRRPVAVVVTEAVASPMALGVFAPRVVLPARLLSSLTPAGLDAVLVHELAHHQRWHVVSAWLRVAACSIWWWQPLIWLFASRLRHVHEEVCDDVVIGPGGVPVERYCDTLLHAASLADVPAGSAAFAQALHPLARRVKRLLETPCGTIQSRYARTATVLLAVAVVPGAADVTVREVSRPSAVVASATFPPAAAEPTPALPSAVPAWIKSLRDLVAERPSVIHEARETAINLVAGVVPRRAGSVHDASLLVGDTVYRAMVRDGAPQAVARRVGDDITRRISARAGRK